MLIVWSGWWWLRKTWVIGLGRDAETGQRFEDETAPGDHPRVDDDQRVAVADQDDAAADAVAGVAGVEEIDVVVIAGCYAARGRRRACRRDGRDAPVRRGSPCHPPAMTDDGPADLVLRGGRVATMDASRSFAAAVAVRDGRIVAVGGDDAVRGWIGPRTRVVELRGRSVTPGFGDAHVHPVSAGRRPVALRPDRCARAGRLPGDDRRRTPPRTRTRRGSAATAGRCPTSRAASHTATISTGSCRIGRSSSRAATATRPGSTPGRSSWPA